MKPVHINVQQYAKDAEDPHHQADAVAHVAETYMDGGVQICIPLKGGAEAWVVLNLPEVIAAAMQFIPENRNG